MINTVSDTIHVKAQYGNQLRRFSMKKIECTGTGTVNSLYTNLVDKIVKLFAIPRNFQLKYKDDEGDLITISSDIELKFAINLFFNSTLRLTVDVHTPVGIDGWKRHDEHELKRRHGRKDVAHHAWKGHGYHALIGHGHYGWKGCGDDKMGCGRKGRGGCRGRGGWNLMNIENKIVMISRKRDLVLERIESLRKENGSGDFERLECILRRLDSKLLKLKEFASEKNNTDTTCQKELVLYDDKKCERRGSRRCRRGGKWRNDPLFVTICDLKKEKRELKMVLRKGFESESEKANAEKRINGIKQEIRQIFINRREKS